MDRTELRLELLKLSHTLARDATEAVARAKTLEAYVLEESNEEKKSSQPQVAGKLKKS
jgi:hypothetical protein